MPVADYKTYCKMLNKARHEKLAYPAINVILFDDQLAGEQQL